MSKHKASDQAIAPRKIGWNLVSAAPDMLEVLTSLMEYWDNGTPVHPGAMIVDEVRAVIAKARGVKP